MNRQLLLVYQASQGLVGIRHIAAQSEFRHDSAVHPKMWWLILLCSFVVGVN